MKAPKIALLAALAAFPAVELQGQEVRPRDRHVLDGQAGQVFDALRPVVKKVAAGTVEVRVWRKRIGFGTVVAPGKVLAKWSDVRRDLNSLQCRTGDGTLLSAKVEGIYRDADLALLEVEGLKAKPISFKGGDDLRLGRFIAVARPDGEAASMGVVSVMPRSLRQSDRAFLGIEMDINYNGPGVKVRRVQEGTGAAKAGLQDGDVVTGLRGRAVNGSFELSSALQRLVPGETIRLKYRRGEEQRSANVTLSGRPDPRRIPYGRMERMNNMGGHSYSEIRDGFRDVIQSDMQIEPEDCGAPVIDLNGNVVGIAAARAGRIKTFIIPSAAVEKLLAGKPDQPRIEELAGRAEPVREGDGPPEEDPFEVMRQHMEEMQRLMQELEEER